VKRGECVGIVGKNGSGKSTLLQIVAATLSPTSGTIEFNGKVVALLELGSGFNPEFTGCENIYMNGMILGLSKVEIDEQYDEIVSFADIGDFINQPVKTYSSGMVVRLAFAIQSQVKSDLLLIDEALAVGDAGFQMKCMARMRNLLEKGVAILLVSHSVQTVRSFCHSAVWLEQGRLVMKDNTSLVTSSYMESLFSGGNKKLTASSDAGLRSKSNQTQAFISLQELSQKKKIRRWGSGDVRVHRFAMIGSDHNNSGCFEWLEDVTIVIEAKGFSPCLHTQYSVAFSCRNNLDLDVIGASSSEQQLFIGNLQPGENVSAQFQFQNIISPGEYMLIMAIEYFANGQRHYCDYVENAFMFQVISGQGHFAICEPKVAIDLSKM
ncbi:MAG: ABC transporter ATP-binding protein, partial [Planctomycetota bacterium]